MRTYTMRGKKYPFVFPTTQEEIKRLKWLVNASENTTPCRGSQRLHKEAMQASELLEQAGISLKEEA